MQAYNVDMKISGITYSYHGIPSTSRERALILAGIFHGESYGALEPADELTEYSIHESESNNSSEYISHIAI